MFYTISGVSGDGGGVFKDPDYGCVDACKSRD